MTGYLAKLKEETCGARPRETLVKRAFAHFGGMRRHPRRPSSPPLPPRQKQATEIEVALPVQEICGILPTRIVRPSTSDARRQGALMLSFCA